MKRIITVFLLLIFTSGCTGCFRNLYKVHEDLTPLKINFRYDCNKQRLLSLISQVNLKYYDSSRCHYESIVPDPGDKIVYFDNCESCLLAITKSKFSVVAIFDGANGSKFWLTKKEQVDDSLLSRIKMKIKREFGESINPE